jgi:hypothetical protein
LIDGYHIEYAGLAANIGQYQLSNPTPSTGTSSNRQQKELKIIFTNNIKSSLDVYFGGIKNHSIPGEFFWPWDYPVPSRNFRIFEKLPWSIRKEKLFLNDVNMTVRILNSTTIDNPIFGVRAGLKVRILEMTLRDETTFVLFNYGDRQEFARHSGYQAYTIAKSKELRQIITKFLHKLVSRKND